MLRSTGCRHYQSDFSRYLDGELTSLIERELEAHLMDCGDCRSHLARLRAGVRMARHVPSFKPAHDRFEEIQKALDREREFGAFPDTSAPLKENRRRARTRMTSARAAVLVLALFLCVLLSISYSALRAEEPTPSIGRAGFHATSIAEIDGHSEPHIVVEGYVAEVRINSEENTLSFKLVANLKQPRPFVICEIIDPAALTSPQVGSQLRVYGVSRYDAQPNHQWYEIHPVIKIETMNP